MRSKRAVELPRERDICRMFWSHARVETWERALQAQISNLIYLAPLVHSYILNILNCTRYGSYPASVSSTKPLWITWTIP